MITDCAVNPAQPTKDEDREYAIRFKRLDIIGSSIQQFIKYGFLAVCFYLFYLSVLALAGKHTFAEIGIKILGSLRISEGILSLLALGGVSYGVGQRNLRRKNIERLSRRNQELEQRLDPNRSSSGLTLKGTTRPGDKELG